MNLFVTLTSDADVKRDLNFDPANPAVFSSWQSVSSNPEVFNQKELNHLIPDMNLSKENSGLLAFSIKEKNLQK